MRSFDNPAEAEFIKCAHNIYNATKISFWNEMWLVAQKMGLDLDPIASTVAKSAEGSINPQYGIRGGAPYGGVCLPKDTCGFLGFADGDRRRHAAAQRGRRGQRARGARAPRSEVAHRRWCQRGRNAGRVSPRMPLPWYYYVLGTPLGLLGLIRWGCWLIRRIPAVLYRPVGATTGCR
jgi:hypothetical protein